jgi:hypothetical protein
MSSPNDFIENLLFWLSGFPTPKAGKQIKKIGKDKIGCIEIIQSIAFTNCFK